MQKQSTHPFRTKSFGSNEKNIGTTLAFILFACAFSWGSSTFNLGEVYTLDNLGMSAWETSLGVIFEKKDHLVSIDLLMLKQSQEELKNLAPIKSTTQSAALGYQNNWKLLYYAGKIGASNFFELQSSYLALLDLAFLISPETSPKTKVIIKSQLESKLENSTLYATYSEVRKNTGGVGLSLETEQWQGEVWSKRVFWEKGKPLKSLSGLTLEAPKNYGWNHYGWSLYQFFDRFWGGLSGAYSTTDRDLKQVSSTNPSELQYIAYPYSTPRDEFSLSALVKWSWPTIKPFANLSAKVPLYSQASFLWESQTGLSSERYQTTGVAPFEFSLSFLFPLTTKLSLKAEGNLIIVPYPGGGYLSKEQWRQGSFEIQLSYQIK